MDHNLPYTYVQFWQDNLVFFENQIANYAALPINEYKVVCKVEILILLELLFLSANLH